MSSAHNRPATSSATPWIIVGVVAGGFFCFALPLIVVVCLSAVQLLGRNSSQLFATVAMSIGNTTSDPTVPGQKPAPPLSLSEPPAATAQIDGKDLRLLDGAQLHRQASAAANQGNYPQAVAYQYWAVQKTKTGRYNLACYYAQTKAIEPAMYYLQVAALDEGIDALFAHRDTDLQSVWDDERGQKVLLFLFRCSTYWEGSGISSTPLRLPQGYQQGTPIPVVVWLHGLGSRPEDFVDDDVQDFADQLKVAIVGVSGTLPRGPRSFAWTESAARDAERIEQALDGLANQLTVKPGHVILMGFSQGGQMSVEIAARDPERYAGAIALSPGTLKPTRLEDVHPSPLLAKRGFVVVVGAKEMPGNVALAASNAKWLQSAKAQVQHKPYPGMSQHTLPPDFNDRFPEWVRFIEKARGN